jgi:ubiquitin-protein ligase
MDLTVKPNTGFYKGGVFKFKITVPPEYNNVVRQPKANTNAKN